MRLTTIDQVRELRFAGNHHHDRRKLDAVHEFLADEARPMPERLEALGVMDAAMGITDEPRTEEALREYLAEA